MIWLILLVLVVVAAIIWFVGIAAVVAVTAAFAMAKVVVVTYATIIAGTYAGTFYLLVQLFGEENTGLAALATLPVGTAILCLLVLWGSFQGEPEPSRTTYLYRVRLSLVSFGCLSVGVFISDFTEPNIWRGLKRSIVAAEPQTAASNSIPPKFSPVAVAQKAAVHRYPELRYPLSTTLLQPFQFRSPYGVVVLPKGTRVQAVARLGDMLIVRWSAQDVQIPVSSTSLPP